MSSCISCLGQIMKPEILMCIPYWHKECQVGSVRECQILPSSQVLGQCSNRFCPLISLARLETSQDLDEISWNMDWDLTRFGRRPKEIWIKISRVLERCHKILRALMRFGQRSLDIWLRFHEICTEISQDLYQVDLKSGKERGTFLFFFSFFFSGQFWD